jgi:predicted nucleic acid-binding Zn ribbon protein
VPADDVPEGEGPPERPNRPESGDALPTPTAGGSPLDLVREALARAKASARERGVIRDTKRSSWADSREPRFSGAHPDERDPQRVGSEIDRMVADNGWQETAQVATVLACWDRLVGADLAAHCRPDRLSGGELVLVAESTAWATQVKLMSAAILATLAAELGPSVVTSVRVFGPSGPDWRHGGRRVPGRGPRDTYG